MKYLLIIFFLSFSLLNVSAQEKHFVFIQADNNQPFYVSLNGKLYSSTAIGYIIVPKLTNGEYSFSIGFAKNAFPEQSFKCTIDNKDLGFNLKNFGEKGWGLFNLQTLDVTMAESGGSDVISKALSAKEAVKDDTDPVISFNRKKKEPENSTEQMPAQATINTVTSQPIAKREEIKPDEIKPDEAKPDEVKPDEVKPDAVKPDAVKPDEAKPDEAKPDEVKPDEVKESTDKDTDTNNNTDIKRSKDVDVDIDVKKVSESRVEDGLHLTYLDGNSKGDTINIIIPSDKSLSVSHNNNTVPEADVAYNNDTSSTGSVVQKHDAETKDNLKFLDINSEESKKDVSEASNKKSNNVTVISNSKCKDVANDDDYTRLRRKMAGETTDEKMINVARKAYRSKCFTTSQIKSLSTLFLSDEGRYNFFKASYNSVSDVAEYSSLQSEFIDSSFADRFNSMIK